MKLKTKTVRRRRVRRVRIKRSPNYSGNLAITRASSLSTIAGCVVDGSYLTKIANNLCFITANTSGTVNYGSLAFMARLVDLWNYSELTVLYDQYAIDKVVLRFIPYATVASGGAAVGGAYQQNALIMHSVIDYDDVALPSASEAGVNGMRERKSYKSVNIMSKMGKAIKYTFKPRIATDVYAGGLSGSSAKNTAFSYCDCDNPNVEGYGFKAIFETITSGGIMNTFVKAEATYYMRFKDNR